MRIALLVLALSACTGKAPAGTATPDEAAPAATEQTATEARTEDAPEEVEKSLGDDGPPPGVKAPGNLPVMTRDAVEAAGERLMTCLDACTEDDADCRRDCRMKHDVGQVEVDDGPIGPPPTPEQVTGPEARRSGP